MHLSAKYTSIKGISPKHMGLVTKLVRLKFYGRIWLILLFFYCCDLI